MLTDKRLLVTGVATTDSIAWAVAERAQLLNAEVILTAPPRDLERAREAAALLPRPAEVIELDVNREEDVERVGEGLRERWGRVDGALHAIAFAPREALTGQMVDARPEAVELAFRTSAFSLAALARLVEPLAGPDGAALVGLDFDAGGGAWPTYNWMGVCKTALQSVSRYLARDLGARRIRVNLVAAGPLHTRAAGGIPNFDRLLDAYAHQAPLGWDPRDAAPVADAALFLLSDLARAVTGEILHVDGGFHAMATRLPAPVGSQDAVAA